MVETKPQTLIFASGKSIQLRSLNKDDALRFSTFLAGLSSEIQGKFRPDDFTLEVAQHLCSELEVDA